MLKGIKIAKLLKPITLYYNFFHIYSEIVHLDTVGKCDGMASPSLIINGYPQAFHTYRINLSPFTKDFRVWGAPIETKLIYLRLPTGSFLNQIIGVRLIA